MINNQWRLVTEYVNQRGLVQHHLQSFNNFVDSSIKEIVHNNQEVKSTTNSFFSFKYISVDVKKPCILNEGARELTPQECRLRKISYSAPVMAMIHLKTGKDEPIIKQEVRIGNIPIMLRSNRCVLHGSSIQQQIQMNEDYYDPGGYFIVNGTEKVMMMVEQTAPNRIIIVKNNDQVEAFITSDTHERKSRTQIILKNKKIYMQHNMFGRNLINIVIIYKAMGITSDQQIMQMISQDQLYQEYLTQSFYDMNELKIYTQKQALVYISKQLMPRSYKLKKSLMQECLDCLATIVLCHIQCAPTNAPNQFLLNQELFKKNNTSTTEQSSANSNTFLQQNYNFQQKLIFISEVIRRVILTQLNIQQQTDRDFYGNKRLECAGEMLALLFEDAFKTLNYNITRLADEMLKRSNVKNITIEKLIDAGRITNQIQQAISTGNIVLDRFKYTIQGASQVLSRFCYISSLGQMTRLSSTFDKSLKAIGPRMLNASQWGICCPSDTPEGESVGIIKNLAVLAQISQHQDSQLITKILFALGVESYELVDFSQNDVYQVFLNGYSIGIHSNPAYLIQQLRKLRRSGKIGYMTSIYYEQSNKSINIACDAGRPCRPLILIDRNTNKSLVTQEDIDKVVNQELSIHDLVKLGKLELIDVNEELNCLIAFDHKDLSTKTQYTHMEIDCMSIYGIVAALVPFPHHNQSPRNVFQCAMGKQALGLPCLNINTRFDTVLYQLYYPQQPLVSGKITRYASHYMQIPAGQNAVVAVTSFSGYDIEDALIMNRASCDRGYGRVFVYKSIDAELDNDLQDALAGKPLGMQTIQDDLAVKNMPESYADQQTPVAHQSMYRQTGEYMRNPHRARLPETLRRYHAIDNDGLARIGAIVEDGDVVANRVNRVSQQQSAITAKLPPQESAVVARVLIAQSQKNIIIKTMTRESRVPFYGDKFSSRHGQKGTVGLVVSQCDMPFSPVTGLVPDQIMNPHGFPSRMTIGKILECLCGKEAVLAGAGADGTLFQKSRVEEVCEGLLKRGHNYHGKDMLISGITGMPCKSYIFEGPIFYQRLKHMVNDKMHARSTGPKQFLTRQPLEGRAKDGGLRLGEMEKDCFIAYGTAALLNERMVSSSDEFLVYVCETCGVIGHEGWCQICKSGACISKIKMPYAAKLMAQELLAMGILMRIQVEQ